MGSDLFCVACGVSYIYRYDTIPSSGNWLYYQCLLTRYAVNKWVCGEYTDWGSGTLDKDKESYNVSADLWGDSSNDAIAMHRDCYLFLKSKNVIDVSFDDLHKKINGDGCASIDYNVVKKYQQQDFNTSDALRKQPWILESPLKNQTKAEYVYKIWLKILHHRSRVLKRKKVSRKTLKHTLRPSPSEHAKDHKGKIKIGNDGYKYKSTKDKNDVYKWKKLK